MLCKYVYFEVVKSKRLLEESIENDPDLFPDQDHVISSLKKKGYPFAPLLKFPAVTDLSLSFEYSFFQSIKNKQERELQSIEKAILAEMKIVLKELASLKDSEDGALVEADAKIDCFL